MEAGRNQDMCVRVRALACTPLSAWLGSGQGKVKSGTGSDQVDNRSCQKHQIGMEEMEWRACGNC